jgi:chaperonin GroES
MDILERFTPVNKKLLVQTIEAESTTKSGLIIPNMAQDAPQQGKVLRASADTNVANEGDIVVFGKYAGLVVKLDQKEYLIMGEEEVLGVLKGE